MTNLFCKITYQMISNCREWIKKGSIPKVEKQLVEFQKEEEEVADDEEEKFETKQGEQADLTLW
jgi:hypothetical protein